MPAPIVFFDIAGPDSETQRAFYRTLFDWDIGDDGRMSVQAQTPLEGLIRKDPADKMLYLGVPDVTATLAQVEQLGGEVTAPRFEVPGQVVLGLFTDPAGNHMGLVEMDGDNVRVP